MPKICLIGNPDSIHVQRWAQHFSQRGFDVTLLSFYQPGFKGDDGVRVRYVRGRSSTVGGARGRPTFAMRFPGLLRLLSAARYRAGGFYRELARIDPDIVHAHYLSDYGVLAALSWRRPLVLSAWGSDVLVDPRQSVITRLLVRWVLQRAELITYDADHVRDVAQSLGAPADRMTRVVLGVDRELLDHLPAARIPPAERRPLILSLRSLERRLYNVDVIVHAMPSVLARVPVARLVIGNDGALRRGLEELTASLGVGHAVEFIGLARGPKRLAELLGQAAVYVSVPSSDGTSVTLLEAMAAGAYPVVSDLPANREWVGGGGGTIVPARAAAPLADAIVEALKDPSRRAAAAARNVELVNREGSWDVNMARMESAYRALVAPGAKAAEERV